MAKGFVVDETQTPASTSTTTSPTATASSSTVPTAPTIVDSTSTDVALPRNIAFDAPLLLPSENADKKQSSDEIEHPHKQEISIDVPSAPPITELVSYNDFSITLSERSAIIAALRNAKLAICHSKSKDTEKQKLAAALEEIYSITTIATSRMSQKQADEISDEIRKIMSARSKILEKKKQCIHASNQSKSIDCLDILAGVLMVLRIIFDIVCIILLVLTYKTVVPSIIPIGGCLFTCYLYMHYHHNNYKKLESHSRNGNIETFFCIYWTVLYGLIATCILVSPVPVIGPPICGYLSMVTCILQRCFKCDNKNLKKARRQNSIIYTDIMMMETGNKINLDCHATFNYQNNSCNECTISKFNLIAVENLKVRIQYSLMEIRSKDSESGKGRTYGEDNITKINITENYTYPENVLNSGVETRKTQTQNANINGNYIDNWWCCYFLDSNPIYYDGGGGCIGCCDCGSVGDCGGCGDCAC